ncbi:kunitz-type protease inhibitor 1b [Megalobrama amblycephala]|uniref:kunitz-type protease inhibitor 1b n=1 Tax=Megalobrama amblycephala TaxID=75352 RepID=UPI00201440C9|nr:kunitz-type protease inhibitor 1b [Megalobrama amblycephala]
MGSCFFLFAFFLFILGDFGGETQSEISAQDQQCVRTFTAGREDFVLDTEESIKDGAVFLANPSVERTHECTVKCCRDPRCNLALVEDGNEKISNNGCFLFNCLYKHTYVCRFIQKQGFTNYILDSVYEHYLNGRKSDKKDKPPIANAGRDVVVQPHEEVLLNGIESWDDKKIVNYHWTLIRGAESVQMEKTELPDQIKVSNLIPGVYEFKLTVTDSADHSDSAKVTVLVLTPEQSERHCLIPKKEGPCRGSFPRWHYNAASSKCERFFFGGCKENSNNYLSEQECLNACKNTKVNSGGESRKVVTEDCSSSCGEDQFKCSNGCCVKKEFECDEQRQCSDGSDEENCEQLNKSLSRLLQIGVNKKAHCTDPPVTGPCRASFTRWYYDPLNKKCHRFTYGGCDGNDNNFETTDNCMNNCSGVTEKDVFARGLFVMGDEELGETRSASVALAVVLVVAILAVLAVLGYFFLKNRRKKHQHQRVATSSPPVAYSEEEKQMVYNSTTAKA